MSEILYIAQYLLGFFEVFMCFEFLRLLFKEKFRKLQQRYLLIICSFILSVVLAINRNFRLYSFVLLIFLTIVISLMAICFFNGNKLKIILVTSFYNLSLALFDIFYVFTIGIIFQKPNFGMYIGRNLCNERILALILTRVMILLIYFFIKYKGLNNKMENVNYNKIIVFIIVVELAGILYFHNVYSEGVISQMAAYWFFFILIMAMSVVLFGMYVIYRNTIDNVNMIECKNEMLEYNYASLYDSYRDSKEIFHNFKSHIVIISQLVKNNDSREKLIEYIDNLQEPLVCLDSKLWSSNEMVDMILNYKTRDAENNNIKIKYSVSKISFSDISIKDSDLCIILSNLLDNAIEACNYIKNSDKWISLSIKHVNDMLIICVENSIERQPKYENGKFLSSKANKKLHGIGIESVRGIVNKYNGYMECRYDDNHFSFDLTLYSC